MCITEFPEGEEREKSIESLYKEIMTHNFPNLGRDFDIQIHEDNRPPKVSIQNFLHQDILQYNCQKPKKENFRSSKRKSNLSYK